MLNSKREIATKTIAVYALIFIYGGTVRMYYQLEPAIVSAVGVDAAVLYSALKSRYILSDKNKATYSDSLGTYCLFRRTDMMRFLGKCKTTVVKLMRKLREAGLVIEKRLGLGQLNHIYMPQVQAEIEAAAAKPNSSKEVHSVNHGSTAAKPTEVQQTNHLYNKPNKSNQYRGYTQRNGSNPALQYTQRRYTEAELKAFECDVMHGGGDL